MISKTRKMTALALALPLAALAAAAPAAAAGGGGSGDHSRGADVYKVDLDELNDSGVDGKVVIVARDGMIRVTLKARGVVPNMLHPQHIHGLDGDTNATCPPESAAGEDGVLTLVDGLDFYGDVLLPLTPFPMAKNGKINYHESFPVSGDLSDLSDEAIVVHGGFVDGEYVATLPVACGEIS